MAALSVMPAPVTRRASGGVTFFGLAPSSGTSTKRASYIGITKSQNPVDVQIKTFHEAMGEAQPKLVLAVDAFCARKDVIKTCDAVLAASSSGFEAVYAAGESGGGGQESLLRFALDAVPNRKR